MRAIAYHEYGGSDRLQLTDLPTPKVGPDFVLIRAKAASVNPVDWKVRAGYLDGYYDAYFPIVPGWDVAGVVEETGPAVTEFKPGDEVFGYVRRDEIRQGTFAELVSAPPRTLALKPQTVTFEEAAAIPLAGLTAYAMLLATQVGEGDTVLVNSAAGGVGHYAVQIAKILGARVIGTASPRNHDFVRELGAEPVSYADGVVAAVRKVSSVGVDAALDLFGGEALEASLELADPSRVASIADPTVGARGAHYIFVRPNAEHLTQLAEWVDRGLLKTTIHRAFELEAAAAAQDLVAEGHVRGKVVITIA